MNWKEFIKRSGIRVTPDLIFKLKINNITRNTPLLIQEFVKSQRFKLTHSNCEMWPITCTYCTFYIFDLWTYFTIRNYKQNKLQWFYTLLNQSCITKERPCIVKVSSILTRGPGATSLTRPKTDQKSFSINTQYPDNLVAVYTVSFFKRFSNFPGHIIFLSLALSSFCCFNFM